MFKQHCVEFKFDKNINEINSYVDILRAPHGSANRDKCVHHSEFLRFFSTSVNKLSTRNQESSFNRRRNIRKRTGIF